MGHTHALPGGHTDFFTRLGWVTFSSALAEFAGFVYFRFFSSVLHLSGSLSECHFHGSQLLFTCSWPTDEVPGKDLALGLPCSVRALISRSLRPCQRSTGASGPTVLDPGPASTGSDSLIRSQRAGRGGTADRTVGIGTAAPAPSASTTTAGRSGLSK